MKLNYGCLSDGRQTNLYQLNNHNGMQVSVLDYGAKLVSVVVPDKNGQPVDVVLGYANAADYENNKGMFGASVGPNCNRIRGAEAKIDGHVYQLEKNNGNNNLHTGKNGIHNKLFKVTDVTESGITLSCQCHENETGLPGNVEVEIQYVLGEDNTLKVIYRAKTDAKTLVNITNHSYFNLNGHKNKNAMNQYLLIDTDRYTPIDQEGVPTGEICSVEGTPFDFRTFQPIEDKLKIESEQLTYGSGFDHNYLFLEDGGTMKESRVVVSAYAKESGIRMDLATNAGALQLYTANHIAPHEGKDKVVYQSRAAFCLEPHSVPDAIHMEQFETPYVNPGEIKERVISYHFSIQA